jgi:hypothetical protein
MAGRITCRGSAIAVFSLSAFLAMGELAHAGCAVGNFQFQPSEAKTVVMTVTRLTKCTVTLAQGGGVTFDNLDITTQPHHGHLGFDGTRSISFTPGSSYVGPDSFTFEVVSHQGSTKSTAVISVFVTIQ